jgi:16S rRNA A1518/A1519 N6-dimethyltransferase RsmA/KsgA/DIM1 with predicted DNA glycosylase/AP lyase activity
MDVDDSYLDSIADSDWEQYFLVNPEKIALIVEAAGIQPTDRVIEIGAGAGTVARHLPPTADLTVVELDDRLIPHLRRNVPSAVVVNDNALAVVRRQPADVLICNLPTTVTRKLLADLDQLSFRTAVISVGSLDHVEDLTSRYRVTELAPITGTDFRPPQPVISYLVRIVPVDQKAEQRR